MSAAAVGGAPKTPAKGLPGVTAGAAKRPPVLRECPANRLGVTVLVWLSAAAAVDPAKRPVNGLPGVATGGAKRPPVLRECPANKLLALALVACS